MIFKLNLSKDYRVVCIYGCLSWILNDKYCRESGPAKEYSDGTVNWFSNGVLHKDDGPAIVSKNGTLIDSCYYLVTKAWFSNGKITEIEYKKDQDNIYSDKRIKGGQYG